MDQTLRLAQFETIYRNSFASPPYTVSNYPPYSNSFRCHWPEFRAGVLVWPPDLDLECLSARRVDWPDLEHTLTGDRIGRRLAGKPAGLSVPPAGSVLNRVDALALALSLGGCICTVRWPSHRQGPWLAGLLFTAAVFTNPRYALAAPLTAFVWLWQLEHRRQALRLAAIVVGSCLVLFLSLNLVTQGGFYLNTVLANLTSFSWYTVTGYLINLYLHAGYLVIGSLIFIVIERLGEATGSWPLVMPYCFGAALMILQPARLIQAPMICLKPSLHSVWPAEPSSPGRARITG